MARTWYPFSPALVCLLVSAVRLALPARFVTAARFQTFSCHFLFADQTPAYRIGM